MDTYRGEVITSHEADIREAAARAASDTTWIGGAHVSQSSRDSYLFSLDKFPEHLSEDEIYVVDGQYKGGATRFLNHSCDPNLRQYTVSSYRGNPQVYELAFFARENIEAFTELTFDYQDLDDPDEPDEEADLEHLQRERGMIATQCRCKSENCRGYLW